MVDYIKELGFEIGGCEGAALVKNCSEEDEVRDALNTTHNGVILCLLNEELGDRPKFQSLPEQETMSDEDRLILEKKKQRERQIAEEEAEKRRYDEIQQKKFEEIFRRGIMGLVVESLELDSWFGGGSSDTMKSPANVFSA